MYGSATAGSDYVYQESTLTFLSGASGAALTQQVVVTVNGDATPENDENFFVQLYGETGATLGNRFGQAVIANDDAAAPVLSVTASPNPVTEGNSGTTPVTFTISLSTTPTAAVTFKYAANYGTATAGVDYVYKEGVGTFAAGASGGALSQTVIVLVNGDVSPEANETFFLQLYDVGGADVPNPFGQEVIQNDDVAVPTISIGNVTGARGTTAQFPVTLSSSPPTAVSVKYTTMPRSYYDTSADPGADFTATAGTLNWAAGASGAALTQTIPVPLLSDGTLNSEIFYVQIYDPVGANLAAIRYGKGSISSPPTAVNDAYTAVGNTKLAVGVTVSGEPVKTISATSVTANDTDPEGDTLTVTSGATSANGGSVAMNADGTFVYVPAASFLGASDSFTYTVSDGFGNSATATVTINISGRVWYVNNALAPAGDGRSTNPFNSLGPLTTGGSADTLDGTGDVLFVYQGSSSYGGGIVLENSQKLTGQPQGLVVGTDTLLPAGGSNPTITNAAGAGITLAQDNVLRRVNVASTSGAGITGTAITNTDVGPNSSVTNTTGTGFALTGAATGTITFDASISENASSGRPVAIQNRSGGTVTMTGAISGSNSGILLDTNASTINMTGLVTMSTGANTAFTISGAGNVNVTVQPAAGINSFASTTGTTVDINNGGSGNVTLDGTISQSNGAATTAKAVSVANHTGGTLAFPKNVTSTNGAGISLSSNTGSTINFSGGTMNLSTGANGAFTATGGGTVNVTGANNTVTTTTGVAVTVTSTIIGASDLTFKNVTAGTGASGPSSGIVLNTTGSSGGLKVTGTGSADSGGIIQKTSGPGISLTSTKGPSFDRMNIHDTAGSGVRGGSTGVAAQITDFTFTNGSINNSGTGLGVDDSNIGLNTTGAGTEQNVTGTVTITGNTLSNAYYHGVDIFDYNGTIANATISDNTITSSTVVASSKGSGIRLIAFGGPSTVASITKATLNNNTITNFPSGVGLQVQGGNANSPAASPSTVGIPGDATNIVAITNNTIHGASSVNRIGAEGMVVLVNGKGQGNFNISGNDIRNTAGQAISHSAFGFATVTSTISNNTIVANNTVASPGIGVGTSKAFAATDTPSLTTTITGNNVSQSDGNGILAVARDATGTLKVKIQNNIVAAPLSGFRPGIRVDSGNSSSANETVCANISGNTSAGSGAQPGIGLRKQATAPAVNAFGVNGMAATSTPGVETYVNGLNPAGNGTLLISATSGFTNCSLP